MSIYIEEDSTRPCYFAPSAGDNLGGADHTEEFRFIYRPALPEERGRVLDETKKYTRTEDVQRLLAKFLEPKIVSWDVKYPNGDPVPVLAKNLLRLESSILHRMSEVVLFRSESGDIDPELSRIAQESQSSDLESAIAPARVDIGIPISGKL